MLRIYTCSKLIHSSSSTILAFNPRWTAIRTAPPVDILLLYGFFYRTKKPHNRIRKLGWIVFDRRARSRPSQSRLICRFHMDIPLVILLLYLHAIQVFVVALLTPFNRLTIIKPIMSFHESNGFPSCADDGCLNATSAVFKRGFH